MATKQVMQDAELYARRVEKEYKMFFLGLLHNAITVEGLPEEVPKRYFLNTLFNNGKIGYGNGLYLPVSGIGIDVYGLPTEYVFQAANGINFTKKAKDCQIFRINDQEYPITPFIDLKCKQIAEIETSIHQNLFAVRTQAVYECADQASLLSLQNAFKARKLGAEVIFQSNAFTTDNKLTVHSTEADYLCDKLYELKNAYINEVLMRLGVMSEEKKKEQTLEIEVNTNRGIAYEDIHIIVDTFNYDAETQGSNLRMSINSPIEDYMETLMKEANDTNALEVD